MKKVVVSENGIVDLQLEAIDGFIVDSGGNTRGDYAVDFQTSRSFSTQVASGNYSVIGGGNDNTAGGTRAIVGGGSSNTASGGNSTVGGGSGNTSSNSYATISGGQYNVASGIRSTVGGGSSNTASGSYSNVFGGTGNISSGIGTIVGGIFNTASNGAVLSGCLSRICTVTIASPAVFTSTNYHGLTTGNIVRLQTTGSLPTGLSTGTNYYVLSTGLTSVNFQLSLTNGGAAINTSGSQSGTHTLFMISTNNTCSGESGVICGGIKNNIGSTNYVSTIVGGYKNQIINGGGNGFLGGGRDNTINGNLGAAIVGGRSNTTASTYAFIGGGQSNTASGIYSSIIGGLQGKATRHGEFTHSSGRFANNGDAQHTILIARISTTDDTANQVLFLNGSSGRLTLPAKSVWKFTVNLSAYNDTDNEAAWWTFEGGIRRNASNGTTLIGTNVSITESEASLSTATADVVADDTNEALEIRVTGVAAKNIRWVAVVDIVQTSYGTP